MCFSLGVNSISMSMSVGGFRFRYFLLKNNFTDICT